MNVRFRPFVQADLMTVRQHMPFSVAEGTRGFVAYDPDTAKTLGIFIAQEWTATAVQVHQVILNPLVLRHGFYQEVSEFIFQKAGRQMMLATVPSDNRKALSINRKLGFREVARIKDAFDFGRDMVIMQLRREDLPLRFWKAAELQELQEVVNG